MGKMGDRDSSLSLPVAAVCCKVKDAMQPAVNIGIGISMANLIANYCYCVSAVCAREPSFSVYGNCHFAEMVVVV